MEKEDRRLPIIDEKRFAILTKESIRLIAEAGGHADLPDDVAALLGEDVSYRLREAAQNGAQYMKHAKRKKMTTDDFNKSLKVSDIQPVHGYRSPENLPFRQTKDGELFFMEDSETNFANVAFSNYVPKNSGETSIKAHWLAVEGVSKVSSALHQNLIKPIIKREDLQMYFDNVTNAILGCDPDAMKIALQDLKTNSQIVPLLPRFVSFVANGVKTVSHDICQLTKLLHTIKALINNTSLYLEPQPYLNMVVQGTTYCLLEPLAASINPSNDHWALRDYAARLLAQIIMSWSSPINHLLYNTVKNLREVLCDHAKPFCCHYGAVMGLTALGYKPVEEVLIPHLPVYWPHLISVLEDTSYANAITKADAHKVHGAMLLAVEFVIKKHIRMFEEQVEEYENNKMELNFKSKEQVSPSKTYTSAAPQLQSSVSQLYRDMYDYFGDSLAIRLPDLCEKIDLKRKVFVGKKQEKIVSLTDPEAAKSGDELLAEFMEQVRIQEILDKERREREKIENARLEVLRKEREEQERILREKQARIDKVKQAEQDKQAHELELLRQHHMRRSAELLEIEKQRHKDMLNQTKKDLRVLKKPSYKEVDTDDEEEMSDGGRRRKAVKIPQLPQVSREVKTEVEEDASFAGPSQSHLAVSTVSDTSEGIKLKFVRRPTLKLQIKPLAVPSPPSRDQKDSKHSGKKRKQSQRTSTSASNFDAYEFIESDPEDFKQQLSFKPHYYSSEGENSDGAGQKKPLKMKLKVKDPQDFTSE
ncbi:TAF6-like RNA polymerase II p300/CBP-associated factor-associated factor 65 kDa subunit 6L [Mizuhopecten yessoensis]|uniref:TAF6-like RNA polymerase II p300/CBP-associated factor-associated factor 65 kDa subunit 6L n=1 Tax=Mizuhopecten yessoensis TaxID=6573 RepID=UPI000B45C3D4|nr:TAF6-like RNA polymerase II p300/CBP-associated factor-associated factor 65 kDa subunit 6L [Mizuhopecten yessoensis]